MSDDSDDQVIADFSQMVLRSMHREYEYAIAHFGEVEPKRQQRLMQRLETRAQLLFQIDEPEAVARVRRDFIRAGVTYRRYQSWPYGPFRKPKGLGYIEHLCIHGEPQTCGYCGSVTPAKHGIPCNCVECGAPLRQGCEVIGAGFIKAIREARS